MKTDIILPDEPSQLIRLAVSDARKLNRLDYMPSSGCWHRYLEHYKVCHVCFAGALMAETLDAPFGQSVALEHFRDFPDSILHKVIALDHFRVGEYAAALRQLEISQDQISYALIHLPTIEANTFSTWEEFDGFLEEAEDLADVLEASGL